MTLKTLKTVRTLKPTLLVTMLTLTMATMATMATMGCSKASNDNTHTTKEDIVQQATVSQTKQQQANPASVAKEHAFNLSFHWYQLLPFQGKEFIEPPCSYPIEIEFFDKGDHIAFEAIVGNGDWDGIVKSVETVNKQTTKLTLYSERTDLTFVFTVQQNADGTAIWTQDKENDSFFSADGYPIKMVNEENKQPYIFNGAFDYSQCKGEGE